MEHQKLELLLLQSLLDICLARIGDERCTKSLKFFFEEGNMVIRPYFKILKAKVNQFNLFIWLVWLNFLSL